MAYIDLIQHLLKINREGGIKLGLQNVQRLQQILHFPDRSFASIHVAGTNGKGSVCLKIATALERAGYRVGLFTSPHISSFRERIRVNGEMISEEAIETILPRLFDIVKKHEIPATFFEITTLLALLHFAKEKIDFAVLETGLGGRLDATNIVTPCLTLITSISLDHTEILGRTRQEIAVEKGGIIKSGIPIIIGPNVPLPPILKLANEKKCICIPVKNSSSLYEDENRSIAKAALDYLAFPFKISPQAMEEGLAAKQPCRFELVDSPSKVILDVAHNPDGIFRLIQAVTMHFPTQPLRFLFGLSRSKDLKACLACITPFKSHYHLVEAPNGRAAPKEEIKRLLNEFSVGDSQISLHSIKDGVHVAREEAVKHNQILVIFGTFFIMGEVRQTLGYREPYDVYDLN